MKARWLAALATVMATGVASNTPVRAGAPSYIVEVRETFGSAAGLITPSDWTVASVSSSPCLTAYSGVTPLETAGEPLDSCSGATETDGAGALRLNEAIESTIVRVEHSGEFTPDQGVTAHFYIATYGGNGYDGTGADGASFYLVDASSDPLILGAGGGDLGYSEMPGAVLGIGFDEYGNFSARHTAPCDDPGVQLPYNIAVRGADTSEARDGSSGYCYLGGNIVDAFTGADRTEAAREVLITIDPAYRASRMINIYFGTVGSLPTVPTLSVPAPDEYISADALRFGFTAATGWGTNIHEVWGLTFGGFDLSYEYLGCGTLSPSTCPTISTLSESRVRGAPGSLHANNRAIYRWLRCKSAGPAYSSPRAPATCTAIQTFRGTALQFSARPYGITARDRSAGYLRLAVTAGTKTYYSDAYRISP